MAAVAVAWQAKGVVLAWILARLNRDRQRGARRAWLAAAQSINIVQMFGGGFLAVALRSGAMRAGPGSGVSRAEALGPQLGLPSCSAPARYSDALLALPYQRQRANRSDAPAPITRPGLVLVDFAWRIAIN